MVNSLTNSTVQWCQHGYCCILWGSFSLQRTPQVRELLFPCPRISPCWPNWSFKTFTNNSNDASPCGSLKVDWKGDSAPNPIFFTAYLLHSPICPLPVPVTTLFCPYQDPLLFHQPPSHPLHALTYNSGQQVPTVAWSQLVSLPWPAHTLLQGALTLSLLIKSLFCFLRDNIKREYKEKLIALLPFQHVCYCYTLLNCKWSMNIPLFLFNKH